MTLYLFETPFCDSFFLMISMHRRDLDWHSYRVKIIDGTVQRATLKNLASGTYYIVMTTYDVDGREGSHSVMVKKTAS